MAARISSRVKSGCLAIRAKIQSECSSNGETLPPLRFGAALPVSLQRWHHRITELTPTLKISAISRRDAPLSTASTARSRKSVEYGLGIDLAPQANQFPQIRLGDSGWESLRFNADGKCSSVSLADWSQVRSQCTLSTLIISLHAARAVAQPCGLCAQSQESADWQNYRHSSAARVEFRSQRRLNPKSWKWLPCKKPPAQTAPRWDAVGACSCH
jgi:hypothetical protein